MELDVTTLDGRDAGKISVSDSIFCLEPKRDLIAKVVHWQLACRRVGAHNSKGGSEVSYTGAKMYTQKGTGRARHSSRCVSQFRGGGKVFGPLTSSHGYKLPKKVRSLALCHAISEKLRFKDMVIVDYLVSPEPKTKHLFGLFKKLGLFSALIIDGFELDRNFKFASRNIPNIDLLPVQGINVYDILRRSKLVLSKSAVMALEDRFR